MSRLDLVLVCACLCVAGWVCVGLCGLGLLGAFGGLLGLFLCSFGLDYGLTLLGACRGCFGLFRWLFGLFVRWFVCLFDFVFAGLAVGWFG